MGKLKDDSNFKVYGWMATKLKLKGNELLIYAVIYSFSRNNNGSGVFNASTAYLSEWTGLARKNVINCLSKLIDRNLIIKLEDNQAKRKPNVYAINKQALGTKRNKTSYETLQALGTKRNTINTIDNNIINTIDNTAIRKEDGGEHLHQVEADDELADICNLYKREISNKIDCSPHETKKLYSLLKEYGKEKLTNAVEIAVERNKKNLRYIMGVLRNDGNRDRHGAFNQGQEKSTAAIDSLRELLESEE